MTVFMLHFGCHSSKGGAAAEQVTADSCVIGGNLAQAETTAREAISHHGYSVGDLIAYSQLDESKAATLNDYETALYLKALQHKPRVAVVFS
jgi:hypothetical protein